MIISKRLLLRLFVGLECFVFFFFYFNGSQGLKKIWKEQEKNKTLKELIDNKEKELNTLKNQIEACKKPFNKEILARCELQMARPEEQVYVIIRK